MSIFDRFKSKETVKAEEQEVMKQGKNVQEEDGQSPRKEVGVFLDAPVERVPATEFVEFMLELLHCDFHTEDRENSIYYLFDYQGGHFRIDASKQNSIISIEFPFIFDVESEFLNLVRTHCNDQNFRTRFSKFLYTYDEAKHRIFIHIFTGFNVPNVKRDEQGTFQAILESHFGLQREFCTQLEAKLKEADKNHPRDFQVENIHRSRMAYLLNEQELAHQSIPVESRSSQENCLTIGHILNQFCESQVISFQELRVVTDSLLILSGNENIRQYNLLDPLLEGQGEQAKLKADEVTYLLKGPDETMMVQVTSRIEAEKAIYFRVNIMCPGLQTNVSQARHTAVNSFTFVVAYDKVCEENHQAEFLYMWEDAKEKLAAKNFKDLTEEQRMICDLDLPNLAAEFYWGKKYYEQKRFYEALIHLEYIFEQLNQNYQHLDKEMMDKFYHVCFLIGFCYNELRQFRKAFYYLDIVFQFHRFVETTEYVNCLVNSKDFRAIYVINGILDGLPNAEDKDNQVEEEEEHEELTKDQEHDLAIFRDFLRRRKAYVLIDLGMLDEAEKLCKELLSEPTNADFALGELAFIQNMKKE